MKQMSTVNIETKRLLLREFTEKNAMAIFNYWASDEKVTE